jgi:excinuclease ABC subunit C
MNLGELFESSLQIDTRTQTPKALTGSEGLPTAKGVLLFADGSDVPIQLLIAANLRRTAIARLFSQTDDAISKRTDIAGITRKIYYTSCFNDFKSLLTYYYICRDIYPDSYKQALRLGRVNYVKIDMSAKWPCFVHEKRSFLRANEKTFGPFPTRRSAAEFIEILQNAFLLCQRPRLINSKQKAASCPYLQMKCCPSPCVGNLSRDEYMEQINAAVSAAGGNTKKQAEGLKIRMTELSQKMDFQEAQEAKKQLQHLEKLNHPSYIWTHDLSEWSVLHIDKYTKVKLKGKRKKEQTYSAFFIRNGDICQLDPFTLDSAEQLSNRLLELSSELIKNKDIDSTNELMSLTAFSLYRSKPAGVWVDCSGKHTPTTDQIVKAICEKFAIEANQ